MPGSTIRSCVVRMEVAPVPKSASPPEATATMRNAVIESLSGTSTVAVPSASSGTRARQSKSVSNSSRVGCRPPAPPCGRAFKP